jgi:hypothetical protein
MISEQTAAPVWYGHFNKFNEWTTIDSWAEGGRFLERFAAGAFAASFSESRPKAMFQQRSYPPDWVPVFMAGGRDDRARQEISP